MKIFPSAIKMTEIFNLAIKLNECSREKIYLDDIKSVTIEFTEDADMTEIFDKVLRSIYLNKYAFQQDTYHPLQWMCNLLNL